MRKDRMINGYSASGHLKHAYQAFKDVFGEELEKRGFAYEYGAYHRQHGVLYQCVGLEYNGTSSPQALVYLSTHPFWANDQIIAKGYNCPASYCLSRYATHSWMENNSCWAMGCSETNAIHESENGLHDILTKPCKEARSFEVKDIDGLFRIAYKDYIDVYLPMLDRAYDENDYIKITTSLNTYLLRFFPLPKVLCYVAYKKRDYAFLQTIYEAIYKKKYYIWVSMAKQSLLGGYKIVNDPRVDQGTKEFVRDFIQTEFSTLKPPDDLLDDVEHRMGSELMKVYEDGDFSRLSYIEEVRSALADFQESYFMQTLGLDFFDECE